MSLPSFTVPVCHPHRGLLALAVLPLWILFAFDGRLHWDEPQYVYTGALFSVPDILDGTFQPSNIDGFSTSRIAHILLVHFLTHLLGNTALLYLTLSLLYTLLLLAAFWACSTILRALSVSPDIAVYSTIITLFSPIPLYLAFKTLPDTPAFLWSAIAVLSTIRILHGHATFPWFVVGAISLAAAAMTKHVLIWTFVSFGIAAFLCPPSAIARASIATICVSISIIAFLLFIGTLHLLGLNLWDFVGFISAASQAGEPLAAKLLHISMTLGILWAVPFIVIVYRISNQTRLFFAWFAIAALPFLLIAPRIEIRYLTPALIPLAGLVALSLDLLKDRVLPSPRRPGMVIVALMVLIAVVGSSSRMAQPLTAHEVEMTSMWKLFRALDEQFGNNRFVIVTPWEYSVFLYLRVAHPDRQVYSVFDPDFGSHADWMDFQDRYFAGQVLRRVDELRAIDVPILYVGFVEAMPISNLRRLAGWLPDRVGEVLTGKLDSLPSLKHISMSWMWDNPALSFDFVRQVGNYVVYRVVLPAGDGVGTSLSAWCPPACLPPTRVCSWWSVSAIGRQTPDPLAEPPAAGCYSAAWVGARGKPSGHEPLPVVSSAYGVEEQAGAC